MSLPNDSIEDLDFDLPCDYPECPDDGTATHTEIFVGCDCRRLVCAGCAAVIAEGAQLFGEWHCSFCDAYWGLGSLAEFVKIERIGSVQSGGR